MSTKYAASKSSNTPQKPSAAVGRIFTSPHKRLPAVTKEMWAQIEAAARVPRKQQRCAEIVEAPDGSI